MRARDPVGEQHEGDDPEDHEWREGCHSDAERRAARAAIEPTSSLRHPDTGCVRAPIFHFAGKRRERAPEEGAASRRITSCAFVCPGLERST